MTLDYSLQYHADQDLEEIKSFWGRVLDIPPGSIKAYRKSNSGELNGRNWRSKNGVLSVRTYDTQFRAQLQAWIDCVQLSWIDSLPSGRGAAW